MKKILLLLVILLCSCGENAEKAKGNIEAVKVSEEEKLKPEVKTDNPANFRELDHLSAPDMNYEKANFNANVSDYAEINGDLSNLINIDKFKGFTENQKMMIKDNGFIVLAPNREDTVRKMYTRYDINSYMNIPSFITSDTAINMYHIFFENTLKNLEKKYFIEELSKLSKSMKGKVSKALENEKDPEMQKRLSKIRDYFSVGEALITGETSETGGDAVKDELKLIETTPGVSNSPIFGFEVNYGQFKPRSHYAGDEELEKYFKAMMWYGLIGFPFEKEGEILYENIGTALTITYFAYLDGENDDLKSWDKIYEPTNLFVGESDDLSILDMKDMLIKIFGENSDFHHYFDEAFHNDIFDELENLKQPQIKNKIIFKDIPTGLQFRFMGQRYTLDADIMQELIEPIVRPVPSALDVPSALNSDRAMKYVIKNSLKDLPEEKYKTKVADMREKINALPDKIWNKNLYNAILWYLREIWEEKEIKGYPYFMQTDAWGDKMLQTGLGNYTELKHDTLLYAKEPAAEKGGEMPLEEPPETPGYVEPQPELYNRLLYLTNYTIDALSQRGLVDMDESNTDNYVEWALTEMQTIYTNLRDISIKELNEEELSLEEYQWIEDAGAYFESVEKIIERENYNGSLASSLVSDIASVADTGEFLEIATGLPEDIFVVLSNREGQLYLARGTTYSFYEFENKEAMKDEEWFERLGIKRQSGEYDAGYFYYSLEPQDVNKDVPKQYDWIYNFKSREENNVETEYPQF